MATTETTFKVGNSFSFSVYPSSLLGTFKGVTVKAVIDASTARLLGEDVDAMHAKVYPTLPDGTINDPGAYNYLLITNSSGAKQIIGLAWIDESTIVEITSMTHVVKIYGTCAEDQSKIRDALIQNGFSDIVITTE